MAEMRIPPAKPDDPEDVSWALSTAEATWNRGERADAIRWLRRAAEAASEAEADDRALELAKAAADLAAAASASPALAPAAAPVTPPGAPTPSPAQTVPKAPPLKPAGPARPVAPRASQPPPAAPGPTVVSGTIAGATRGSTPPPRPVMKPSTNALKAVTAPRAPLAPKVPTETSGTPKPAKALAATMRSTVTPDLQKEMTKATTESVPPPAPATAPDVTSQSTTERFTTLSPGETQELDLAAASMDVAWSMPPPTREGTELEENKTRIGAKAYREEEDEPPVTGNVNQPASSKGAVRASQAVRVVVWRTQDGVRVAPYGTRVNAISVEAYLVATDPSADLSAWLS